MSGYTIKEMFLTLQGEGMRAGTKAVFVRFTGCNLWDGHPDHRDKGKGACAQWCDTDFYGGSKLSRAELLADMNRLWPSSDEPRWCVLTGGEPALQLDEELVTSLQADGWSVAIETNGTRNTKAVALCDHICLSPKLGSDWDTLTRFDELKVVVPGGNPGWSEEQLLLLAEHAGNARLYVQPQDGPDAHKNLRTAIAWVQDHARWSLSIQTHKLIGLP